MQKTGALCSVRRRFYAIRENLRGHLNSPATRHGLTRARQWGSELRAREGGGTESAPLPTQFQGELESHFLWKVIFLKISIVYNFGDPKLISSRSKHSHLKNPEFVGKCISSFFRPERQTIIDRNDSKMNNQ